jgi:hypothetical protein
MAIQSQYSLQYRAGKCTHPDVGRLRTTTPDNNLSRQLFLIHKTTLCYQDQECPKSRLERKWVLEIPYYLEIMLVLAQGPTAGRRLESVVDRFIKGWLSYIPKRCHWAYPRLYVWNTLYYRGVSVSNGAKRSKTRYNSSA